MTETSIGHDAQVSGARLFRFIGKPITKPASPSEFTNANWQDFEADHVAIFIHGFTANSSYLGTLMQEFVDNGIVSLAFNYPSYAGIDAAANELSDILSDLNHLSGGLIKEKRSVVLVCHSMGGLVARAFVSLNAGNQYVAKVITLGTPHDATLTDSVALSALVTWGEHVTGLAQGGYSTSCRSAKQLMMKDTDAGLPFLAHLLSAPAVVPDVQVLSVSGGKKWLQFGKNVIHNKLLNAYLQWGLGNNQNDGLVKEVSSDFSQLKFRACFPQCVPHVGNGSYSRYSETNHSQVINTQAITLKAIAFAIV